MECHHYASTIHVVLQRINSDSQYDQPVLLPITSHTSPTHRHPHLFNLGFSDLSNVMSELPELGSKFLDLERTEVLVTKDRSDWQCHITSESDQIFLLMMTNEISDLMERAKSTFSHGRARGVDL